ncbi:MAG: hypothetical protein M0R17_05810 [Candidatus Omnitrophica bacterium]|jgi:hypothetical protein|nr:hypothetical protein [Candidatus Omnitrophota bacterium]
MLLGKNTDTISVKEWEDGMFQYRIPKDLRPIITKELEMMGLIKRVGNRELKILDSKYNPADLRNFKKAVGLI